MTHPDRTDGPTKKCMGCKTIVFPKVGDKCLECPECMAWMGPKPAEVDRTDALMPKDEMQKVHKALADFRESIETYNFVTQPNKDPENFTKYDHWIVNLKSLLDFVEKHLAIPATVEGDLAKVLRDYDEPLVGFKRKGDLEIVLQAARAHASQNAELKIPEGYALVPIEPTEEMFDAMERAWDKGFYFRDVYKAALAEIKGEKNG